MSGGPPHHPHNRQVPAANTAWNHLQVSYFYFYLKNLRFYDLIRSVYSVNMTSILNFVSSKNSYT